MREDNRTVHDAAGQAEPAAGEHRGAVPGEGFDAVRQYGDPVLRSKARPIRKINAGVRGLADRMARTMYATKGVGLAAPQVGVARRLVVIDAGDGLMTLVNPRLIWSEGTVEDVEGCLSVGGLVGEVQRAERVRVRALDLDGKEVTVEGEGLLARALQHELDHLDGVLFVDRATGIRSTSGEDEPEESGGDQPEESGKEDREGLPPHDGAPQDWGTDR